MLVAVFNNTVQLHSGMEQEVICLSQIPAEPLLRLSSGTLANKSNKALESNMCNII